MRLLCCLAFLVLACPAVAQTALACGWQARADAIVEPWEDHSATFSNGAVRVAVLDVAEPVAAAAYLLITHPAPDVPSGRTCTLIGLDDDLGYAAISFDQLKVVQDTSTGLIFTVPAIIHLPEQSFQNAAVLSISVNQSTGAVKVTQDLGDE